MKLRFNYIHHYIKFNKIPQFKRILNNETLLDFKHTHYHTKLFFLHCNTLFFNHARCVFGRRLAAYYTQPEKEFFHHLSLFHCLLMKCPIKGDWWKKEKKYLGMSFISIAWPSHSNDIISALLSFFSDTNRKFIAWWY